MVENEDEVGPMEINNEYSEIRRVCHPKTNILVTFFRDCKELGVKEAFKQWKKAFYDASILYL